MYKKCIGIFKCDIMSDRLYNENLDIFFVVWKCFKKFNKVFLNLCDDFIEYRKFLLMLIFIGNFFFFLDFRFVVVVLLKRYLSFMKVSVIYWWFVLCYDNI